MELTAEIKPQKKGVCSRASFNVTTQDVAQQMIIPRWQMSAPKDIDPTSAFLLLWEMSWFDWNDIYLSFIYVLTDKKKRRNCCWSTTATADEHQSQIKRNENKQTQLNGNNPHILTVSIAKERKWKKRVNANQNGHELRLNDIKAIMIAQIEGMKQMNKKITSRAMARVCFLKWWSNKKGGIKNSKRNRKSD